MHKKSVEDFFDQINVPYVIYGNFNFVDGKDEDVDVLIKENYFPLLKNYLIKNKLVFHERKYYPGQIFVTGTTIKIHVTKDLFVGGRRVAYLLESFLIDEVMLDHCEWNSYKIISFNNYVRYRKLKKIFNSKKQLKLSDYPTAKSRELDDSNENIYGLMVKVIFLNSFFIISRFIKKRIWVRL